MRRSAQVFVTGFPQPQIRFLRENGPMIAGDVIAAIINAAEEGAPASRFPWLFPNFGKTSLAA
jgi:hypothetical protein